MKAIEIYNEWLENDFFDENTKKELLEIKGDSNEIEERFYKDLEFGTGGIRGIIGAGINRMNIYTVGRATQGLANYIKKQKTEAKGIVIAYDPRNMSKEFATHAGCVMAANGIKTYIFDELRPTPELSFAVRELGCTAGIVITASHNPPEYNGYKVYWDDGGQVPYPRDEAIISEVNAIENFWDVLFMDEKQSLEKNLIEIVGKELDDAYDKCVNAQVIDKEVIEKCNDLKIVYTPINGTGNKPVKRALASAGFKNVHIVKEQEEPDGNFTTVGYPNPEDPKTFSLAIKLAKEVDADVILGTDPDADRVGVVVKDNEGRYVVLTGNMSGTLIAEYIIRRKKELGTLPTNGALIKTIVSTEMIRPICEEYGLKVFDVLTGFKYIGEKIKQFEETGDHTYVFGFEESYGSLSGTYARDKDAVSATLLLCEIAAYYKVQGLTLYDALQNLYKKYGFYYDGIKAISLKGIEGLERIKHIMTTLRNNTPSKIADLNVTWARDYEAKQFTNIITKEIEENLLPASNVLHYTLEDGSWICARPSGTEPKLKLYYGIKGVDDDEAAEKSKAMQIALLELVESIK